MAVAFTPLGPLLLELLAVRESGFLVLMVAVRKSLGPRQCVKGELGPVVKTALRKLIASGAVVESDGTFSLKHVA